MTSLAEETPGLLQRGGRRSLTARLEERLMVASYSSSWAFASINLHRALSLPLQLHGEVRLRSVVTPDATIRLLTLGRAKLVDTIAAGLVGSLPEPSIAGRRSTWSGTPLVEPGADLVVAEVHRWMADRFRRAGWLIVPRSVRWQGELAAVPPAAPNRSLKANLAKLRKQNFTLVEADTPDDWTEFYTTMVEPQARSRHGSSAWIPSEPFLRQLARRGTLHFIVEDGVRVAGGCTVAYGDTLWFPLMGVRHGDPGLLQRGASVAALALPLQWARERGYHRVDLGRTGTFVNDGLQQHKRSWGLTPVPDALSLVTAVRIGSPVARRAFADNPVLIETGTGLEMYAGAE